MSKIKASIVRLSVGKDRIFELQMDGDYQLSDFCLSVEKLDVDTCTKCGNHGTYLKSSYGYCINCHDEYIRNENAAIDEMFSCGYW